MLTIWTSRTTHYKERDDDLRRNSLKVLSDLSSMWTYKVSMGEPPIFVVFSTTLSAHRRIVAMTYAKTQAIVREPDGQLQ